MTFVDGGGWGSGKTQNKMTSFMNSALRIIRIIRIIRSELFVYSIRSNIAFE